MDPATRMLYLGRFDLARLEENWALFSPYERDAIIFNLLGEVTGGVTARPLPPTPRRLAVIAFLRTHWVEPGDPDEADEADEVSRVLDGNDGVAAS